MNAPDPKLAARATARRALSKLSPSWLREAGTLIQQAALALPEVRRARQVALYMARSVEPSIDRIAASLRDSGAALALPAWDPARARYGWSAWPEGTALKKGPHGIPEPTVTQWLDPSAFDLVLVPCLAFDADGWRLGHGGGHYDRLLAGCSGFKLGLAFSCQKMAPVPCDPHDIPLHAILTERALHRAPSNLRHTPRPA